MIQKLYWTEHVKAKMRQYRLSENRVKRVLRFPNRLEEGIAPRTVAGMQRAGSKKHPYEIWTMWQTKGKKKGKFDLNKEITIISAWRYPGVSPVNAPPPIPEDVWEIIRKEKIKNKGFLTQPEQALDSKVGIPSRSPAAAGRGIQNPVF